MGKNFKAGDAYAYALLKVLYNETDKEKSFKGLVSDILDFVMVLKTCPTIEEFLANPTYSVKQKKDFLKEFFGNSLNIVIMNFLNVLCDSKRIINISLITNLFLELLLKNTNSHLVEIQTPLIKDYKLDIKKLIKTNQIIITI
jgi:F0F1-type ATP synthase delta subunit